MPTLKYKVVQETFRGGLRLSPDHEDPFHVVHAPEDDELVVLNSTALVPADEFTEKAYLLAHPKGHHAKAIEAKHEAAKKAAKKAEPKSDPKGPPGGEKK